MDFCLICHRCDGRGIVLLNYHDGQKRDLGICSCRHGAIFRRLIQTQAGEDLIRARFNATESVDRVCLLDDLLDGPEAGEWTPAPADKDLLVNAGKVNRAGLGGKAPK